MAGTAPGEQGLIHLVPSAPSLWFGLVLTVNAPRSLCVVHGYPPGKRMTLCSKDTRRFLARSAHDGSVEATTTSGDEPHDSGKIYLLRLYHYVRILVRTMRWDDVGFHPNTQQEAHQCGREVAATGTANKARIIIKGEHGRQAILAQKLGHCL
jgi:hypothetical protein